MDGVARRYKAVLLVADVLVGNRADIIGERIGDIVPFDRAGLAALFAVGIRLKTVGLADDADVLGNALVGLARVDGRLLPVPQFAVDERQIHGNLDMLIDVADKVGGLFGNSEGGDHPGKILLVLIVDDVVRLGKVGGRVLQITRFKIFDA